MVAVLCLDVGWLVCWIRGVDCWWFLLHFVYLIVFGFWICDLCELFGIFVDCVGGCYLVVVWLWLFGCDVCVNSFLLWFALWG